MHLVDCENPQRVYNKYLGEYIHVRCGVCPTCRKYRQSVWVARLERERSCHLFSAFVTLTYSDEFLPVLEPDVHFANLSYLSVDMQSSECVPFNEIKDLCKSDLDSRYLVERIAHSGGIPFADFKDIQYYHKRLNKYIHDKISKTYNNFRFFTVSEYGSTTHRPHFHEILFFDNPEIARRLPEAVNSCWSKVGLSGQRSSIGITDVQLVEKSANSYVAQYINELFDLPSFFNHSVLRPRFVCSKRPPIGVADYDSAALQKIFDSESPTISVWREKDTRFEAVPLLPCIKNRLFPIIADFKSINHSLRVELYGLAITKDGKDIESFDGFYYKVRNLLFNETGRLMFAYFQKWFVSKDPLVGLKRFYYQIKKVCLYCLECNFSVNSYVCKIERFISNFNMSLLRSFYRFQEDYSKVCKHVKELIHCYPEFVFQNPYLSIIPLSSCADYSNMCVDSKVKLSNLTKSHYKNAFIESRSETNSFFKFLITYYAQKCNEVVKALA